ncbi:hypothetical protein [uncultured Roseobacter sp.]|uniref:hypothetical protein n=1 Tax=uncultured Roseobacter sp. TaxID=114847 RepID=UPI002624F2F6|nr:hypothetical protein [uncultured Roseobacter sp.]
MSPSRSRIATSLMGAAGEHYVMSCLLRRGYIAALAPEGAPNLDIVVSTEDGRFQTGIQVKTRRGHGADRGWHMSAKHENIVSPTLYYCFVDFVSTSAKACKVWIVPSETVADAVRLSHATWLATPGAKGQQRKDSTMRRFLPDYERVFGAAQNPYPDGWLDPFIENWGQLADTH